MTDESFDLSVTRLIDAPLEAVWRAWVDHTAEWYCPEPWRAEIVERDLRPGGHSSMIFHGPDGEAMPVEGVFLEVLPQRRIVATDAFAAGWAPRQPFLVRIDAFAPEGVGTRYTATARHWTAIARDQHIAMGFDTGWSTATDQLAAVARRLTVRH